LRWGSDVPVRAGLATVSLEAGGDIVVTFFTRCETATLAEWCSTSRFGVQEDQGEI
jgi:hypothetical protein